MDDHEILQHLLNLEADAAALVNDAQAEADRRVSEGEKQNRTRYDDVYAGEVAVLEEQYVKALAAIKENYRKQLDEYREDLKKMTQNTGAFSLLAEDLFFTGKQ